MARRRLVKATISPADSTPSAADSSLAETGRPRASNVCRTYSRLAIGLAYRRASRARCGSFWALRSDIVDNNTSARYSRALPADRLCAARFGCRRRCRPCRGGEIGRRAAFRAQWANSPCGFESHLRHSTKHARHRVQNGAGRSRPTPTGRSVARHGRVHDVGPRRHATFQTPHMLEPCVAQHVHRA